MITRANGFFKSMVLTNIDHGLRYDSNRDVDAKNRGHLVIQNLSLEYATIRTKVDFIQVVMEFYI